MRVEILIKKQDFDPHRLLQNEIAIRWSYFFKEWTLIQITPLINETLHITIYKINREIIVVRLLTTAGIEPIAIDDVA